MNWDDYFERDCGLVNTAPVEAVIKPVAYWLRRRSYSSVRDKALEIGCGAGATLVWLAGRGAEPYGIDVSARAVDMAQQRLYAFRGSDAAYSDNVTVAEATELPFGSEFFDIVVEANVIQHLPKVDRAKAYGEIDRVLKSGGLFVGYSLSRLDSVFKANAWHQLDDSGTVVLKDESLLPGLLPNVGLTHFFEAAEFAILLPHFDVEILPVMYTLPSHEAKHRGYSTVYENHFYVVHAIKR